VQINADPAAGDSQSLLHKPEPDRRAADRVEARGGQTGEPVDADRNP
jgi:hypothetical protein